MKSLQNTIRWVGNMSGVKLTIITLAMIAGFIFFKEIQPHILSALPYLIFLLCPLMHIFMHGGHGNHNNKDTDS